MKRSSDEFPPALGTKGSGRRHVLRNYTTGLSPPTEEASELWEVCGHPLGAPEAMSPGLRTSLSHNGLFKYI